MATFNKAKHQHNPRKDLHVPWAFFNLPATTQVMYRQIRKHVDKYARCDFKHHSIVYSCWNDSTGLYEPRTLTCEEAARICNELFDG